MHLSRHIRLEIIMVIFEIFCRLETFGRHFSKKLFFRFSKNKNKRGAQRTCPTLEKVLGNFGPVNNFHFPRANGY